MRVVIIPGFWANWMSDWYRAVALFAEACGHLAAIVDIKRPWLPGIEHRIRDISAADDDLPCRTVIIAHSLGCAAAMAYLERSEREQAYKALVLIAPCQECLFNRRMPNPLRGLWRPDYQRLRERVSHVVTVHSKDDWRVPLWNSQVLSDRLGARLFLLPREGHFTGTGLPRSVRDNVLGPVFER